MGLVMFGGLGLYLLISIAVVLGAIAYARRTGRGTKRWGAAAALGMYLLVFWDHIPTIVVHKYYCEREAGSWVYKTVDQWKAENPGVLETLDSKTGKLIKSEGDMDNYTHTSWLNQRFIFVGKHHGPFFLHRWRREKELVDSKTGEVLAREIDFSTSQVRRQAGWTGWKFWLAASNCSSYSHLNHGESFSTIIRELAGRHQ